MYKEFKTSRVCVIDFLPLFVEAVKETYNICKKYHIPFGKTYKQTKDVQKFFYHYCLEKFCSGYKNCKSRYPKVLVVYPLTKNILFSDKNLNQILKVLPIAWVKVSSFNSPDLEMAAYRTINKTKNKQPQLLSFANKNALYSFLKKHKNSKHFLTGTVDFSDNTD